MCNNCAGRTLETSGSEERLDVKTGKLNHWLRVITDAGEDLEPVDAFRYAQIAREMFRLFAQNYVQWSTNSDESADWVINQLVQAARESPRRQAIFKEQIESLKDIGNSSLQPFVDGLEEIDPPEFRRSRANQFFSPLRKAFCAENCRPGSRINRAETFANETFATIGAIQAAARSGSLYFRHPVPSS